MTMKKWILIALVLPSLITAQNEGEGDALDQDEPTAPPTSQFQGPESGYIVTIQEGSGPQINQDRFVDYDYCFGSLARNDVNGDGRLKRVEFENFVQDFGGATECLGPLAEVPIEIVTVWNQLSCECANRGGAADCCIEDNANIPITGVDPSDPFFVEEQQYLREVCLRTDQAIVTYCGPPPPPIIPPIPPGFFLPPPLAATSTPATVIVFPILAIIIILCPWRRRCIFCEGAKDEDEGGMHHQVMEEEPPLAAVPDIEAAAAAEPADDGMQLRAVGDEEDGEFGGTTYGRTVEQPEYVIEGAPKKFVYEQYALPEEPPIPMALKPIPVKVTTEEDEPYDLEHYVPDGGIVEYEREGEWRYDADGGWTPEEREGRAPIEMDPQSYERAVPVVAPVVDNRRDRHLDAYVGGAIFDILGAEPADAGGLGGGGGFGDMFDWVIQSTLDTLDERGDDLQGSIHTSDDSSRGSGR